MGQATWHPPHTLPLLPPPPQPRSRGLTNSTGFSDHLSSLVILKSLSQQV